MGYQGRVCVRVHVHVHVRVATLWALGTTGPSAIQCLNFTHGMGHGQW
jgi:hypothetical protein